MQKTLSVAAVLLLVVSLGSTAVAMSPPVSYPSHLEAVRVERGANLELRSARIEVECTGGRTDAVCDFTQRYVVRNPDDQSQSVRVGLSGYRVAGVEFRVGGALLRSSDEAIDEERFVGFGGRDLPEVTRSSYATTLDLDASEEVELVVTGTMQPRSNVNNVGFGPMKTRHPVLGGNTVADVRQFGFHVEPIESWASYPTVAFAVRAPDDWDVSFTPEVEAALDPAATGFVSMSARLPTPGLHHGGPFVGLGAVVDDRGFVGRIGYEFGQSLEGFYSLAVDSDFRSWFVVAPTLLAGTANVLCIFPSFALGVAPTLRAGGVPLHAGVRGQAEIHFPAVGVAATFDWFPAADDETATVFAVMGRVGF